jgi:GrpB-like predicted nucleotidyltransferase (UPF0157 family)
VILVAYDADWPRAFECERARIADALDALALRIDHVGSTAVPGLVAKPIVDIQVSVVRLHPIAAYGGALVRLGYTHMAHADDAVCPFFHAPRGWPHTHHVHVVEAGGDEERRTLAFRDALRRRTDVAAEYAVLKQGLAARLDGDDAASREAYAAAKSEFVARVVREARLRLSP